VVSGENLLIIKYMDISICIPTYNNKAILSNCLKSIYEKTRGLSFEVIVCDDSSRADTAEMLASEFPEVKLIKNQIRQGYTKSINRAILAAKGDKILLLNNDTVFIDNPLPVLNDYLNKYDEVGAITCKMLNLDGSFQKGFNVRRFPDLWFMLWEALMLDRVFPKGLLTKYYLALDFDFNKLQEVDQPAATFLMLKREIIGKIGFLDETMLDFFSDVDYCKRIRDLGWKILYQPQASIFHLGSASYLLIPKKEAMVNSYRDRFSYVRKHFGKGSLLVLKSAFVFGMILRMILYWLIVMFIRTNIIKLKNVDPKNSIEAFISYKETMKMCLR